MGLSVPRSSIIQLLWSGIITPQHRQQDGAEGRESSSPAKRGGTLHNQSSVTLCVEAPGVAEWVNNLSSIFFPPKPVYWYWYWSGQNFQGTFFLNIYYYYYYYYSYYCIITARMPTCNSINITVHLSLSAYTILTRQE